MPSFLDSLAPNGVKYTWGENGELLGTDLESGEVVFSLEHDDPALETEEPVSKGEAVAAKPDELLEEAKADETVPEPEAKPEAKPDPWGFLEQESHWYEEPPTWMNEDQQKVLRVVHNRMKQEAERHADVIPLPGSGAEPTPEPPSEPEAA